MSDLGSDNGRFGVVPIKGEGWMHFRFHGGPQLKGNRVFMLGTGTFVELQKGAEELLGDESNAIFYEAGIRSGREAWETLKFEFKSYCKSRTAILR